MITPPDSCQRHSHLRLMLLSLLVLTAGLATFALAAAPRASADGCPNAALRTGPSANLPDCRGYEMVTPANKNGVDIATLDKFILAWPQRGGDRVLFRATGAMAGTGTAWGGVDYEAIRGADGWHTTPAAPAAVAGAYRAYVRAVSDDASRVALTGLQGDLFNWDHVPATFQVGPYGGPYTELAALPPGNSNVRLGGDPDLSHVVLGVTDPTALMPPATGLNAGGHALYEAVDGALRLVNVRADGSLMECGAALGDDAPLGPVNAVSASGSEIFFESPDPSSFTEPPSCGLPRLYVREDGSTTVEASAPQGVTDASGPYPVAFAGAPRDGSAVYFVTAERLLPDVVGNEQHLYRYDVRSHLLTHVSGGPDGNASGAAHIVRVSDDGSTVYFFSRSRLVPGEGVEGAVNLYRYDVGSGSYHFVATVGDQEEGEAADERSQWYTTPDGRYLLFASRQPVTQGAPPATNAAQVYRYSAAAGSIDCVSCPPPGVPATGSAELFALGSAMINRYMTSLTDDGSTALFDTPDPLVEGDTNGVADVYEWRDGTVRLISSGTDPSRSLALGLSADGRDAFFSTFARLLPDDQDDFGDIYDARIGGGFRPPANRAICRDDSCQGQPSAAPQVPDAVSTTILSPGSLSASAPRHHAKSTLRMRGLSAAQRTRLARTGRVSLSVVTSRGGRIGVRVRALIRGKAITVGEGARSLHAGGLAHVELRLSRAAMHELHAGRTLKVRIVVTCTGVARPQVATVVLHGGRR